jgi:hypothetical protein
MDEFTKNDIGKKVYTVGVERVDTSGFVLVNLGVVQNVSVDGECAKVLLRTGDVPEEYRSNTLAKSYDGLKSLFEGLVNSRPERYKLMAYRRKLDNACVCIVDTQTTDKYGDTTFWHAQNVNGNTPTWKYGTSTDKGLMTVDEVCMFINELFNYPFGTIYTMDEATDDWWMCPHCGSSDTDIDGEYGGGDERFIEHYSCRKCNCRWENIYDRAPRLERKLIK